MARQFHVPYDRFGYIFALQYVCFALASLSGGHAQHRYGFSNAALVSTGVFGTALLLMMGGALSSFGWIVLWIVPLGFAGGLTEAFSSIMVAGFERGDSSRLLNLSQVFYCIGAILAPQLVAMLLEREIAWRAAFLVFGIFVLCIGCFFVVLNRNLRRSSSTRSVPSTDTSREHSGLPLWRDASFYCMAGIMFLYVVVEMSSASWIAAYFEGRFALPVSSAARRLSLFWTGLIIGRALMVVLPARYTLWPGLIGGAFGMVVGSVLLALSSGSGLATVGVVLYGVAAGPVWPVTAMLSQRLSRSNRFTSGVIGAGGLGAAVGPLFGSYILRDLGLGWFFPLLSAGCVMLFSMTLIVRRL